MKRNATAVWQGTGKEGNGTVSTASTVLSNTPYTYKSRFEDGIGTNPEELIAAAHAGCFTMKLAFNIDAAGFKAEKLESSCEVNLEAGEVTYSHITVNASVPGMDETAFNEAVADAEANCPISKLLDTEISVDATLNG
jgi:osmotically inducible protein OsmC